MITIEICFVCGFIHRDDTNDVRQHKLHHHFTSYDNFEVIVDHVISDPGISMPGTICTACLTSRIEPLIHQRPMPVGKVWAEARYETKLAHRQGSARYNSALRKELLGRELLTADLNFRITMAAHYAYEERWPAKEREPRKPVGSA